MAKITLNERRAQLTAKIRFARQEWRNITNKVTHEVRKANPDIQWYEEMELVEADPRVLVANATLLALCDAANIMGAEID